MATPARRAGHDGCSNLGPAPQRPEPEHWPWPIPRGEPSVVTNCAHTPEDVAAAGRPARRRPTAHEHLMTDLPDSAADPAADASTPDGDAPAGDPELAALVQRGTAGAAAADAAADATAADAPAPSEPTEAAPADAASDPDEPGVDAVPVLPVAARRDRRRARGTPSAEPTVARLSLRRLVRRGLPGRRRHRRRRPVRMGPAVRRSGPARRPHRQHRPRRPHPRAGRGGRSRAPMGRSATGRSRSPARTARRPPSATPTSAVVQTPRRWSTPRWRQAARASPSRT